MNLKRYNVPPRYTNAQASDFPDNVRNLVRAGLAGPGFFIFGPVGVGKTHLSVAILRAWIETGVVLTDKLSGMKLWGSKVVSAAYLSVHDLLGEIKATFDRDSGGSESQIIARYGHHTKGLILDDIGREHKTEWAMSIMYSVVEKRVSAMLPTIVTSNFGLEEIGEWDDAVASRLGGLCQIQLRGEDKRKQEAVT